MTIMNHWEYPIPNHWLVILGSSGSPTQVWAEASAVAKAWRPLEFGHQDIHREI